MPKVSDQVPITSVFGEPREGFSRHTFVAANFFMQRLLNRFRDDLNPIAQPAELDAAANRTIAYLKSKAARIAIQNVEIRDGRLNAEIGVQNLGGHKLPSAYPSRRVWLHLKVTDRAGKVVFESGALNPDGSITGNDNDVDPKRFEPHYSEITRPDQVQIYESVMVGQNGEVTTGLLTAVRYVKDNRLLPRGFDKASAAPDIAVHGGAETDPDFVGGGDTLRYSIAVGEAQGPLHIDAELWYQPIGYRWAMNLNPYDSAEPRRFVGYYQSAAAESSVILASASASR